MSNAVGYVGFGGYVPPTELSNADLERIVDTDDEWIQRRTGIRTRRILAEGETILDMAVRAARAALADAGVDPAEIDDIRVGVNTWLRFPSLAARLQEALGAPRASAADVSAGCAGFVYAVEQAYHRILVEKARYGRETIALVVGVDGLSHITDWTDRQTCVLLGDGAGAVVLRHVPTGGILATHTHADGRYGDVLWSDCVLSGQANGSPKTFTHETTGPRAYLHMDGKKVFAVAVETMVDDVLRVIGKHRDATGERIGIEDVDYVYPHQANLRILEMVGKRLGVPIEKVYTEGVVRYGNTSTASIPLGYWDNRKTRGAGRLEVDVAFGAGFASGAILRRT
ncbi:MAG: beta-ketoacyl-ACP synthase 3 [Planctomycetes bacterium]|nr:beta-ketoacyl-ACP synthase 3 [Planctomycetota bacterium]